MTTGRRLDAPAAHALMLIFIAVLAWPLAAYLAGWPREVVHATRSEGR